MDNFRNAVKAFIVKDGSVLFLRRPSNDAHKPGEWDIPGGRIELGEDPHTALHRELYEETGMAVDINMPISLHHFTRDDGQRIAMTIFWCSPKTTDIVLSEEHEDYKWVSVDREDDFPLWLSKARDIFLEHSKILL